MFLQTRMRKRIIKKKIRIHKQSKNKEERKLLYIEKQYFLRFNSISPFLVKLVFREKNYSNAKIENMNPVNRYYVNQDNDVHSACLKID